MDDMISRQAAIRTIADTECEYDISPYIKDERTEEQKRKDWFDMCKVLFRQIIEDLPSAQPEITFENLRKYCEKRHLVILTREFYDEMKRTLQSVQPERMTNRQWVDFLSAQFDISRTSAKEMLHGMMRWKKEDNFKKMFNGGKT